MDFRKQKFTRTENVEFFGVLRNRVHNYFEAEDRSKYGDWSMVVKTIVMLLLYFTPYLLMLLGVVTHPLLIILLWGIMGLGMAGIGVNIMHDANHGAYSPKKWINKFLGNTLNIIGASADLWKLQHNVLHHTYTNVHGIDEDIQTPILLRFSPHEKRYWIHRFQFLYFWFFYGFLTLSWMTSKEFFQVFRYRNIGLITREKEFRKVFMRLVLWKVFYFSYTIVLPIIFFPGPTWLILVSFLAMHWIAGFVLSLIFQTAHVMPSSEYVLPNSEGKIENTWAVHELMTTSNYAPSSRVFSWLIGGLNYQVEHHLFPNVCHIHYRGISKIVSATAKEFGLPYHTQKNFITALWSHIKMLHKLGRRELAK